MSFMALSILLLDVVIKSVSYISFVNSFTLLDKFEILLSICAYVNESKYSFK